MSLGGVSMKLRSVKSTSRSSQSVFLQDVGQEDAAKCFVQLQAVHPPLISPRFDQWQLQKEGVS